MSITYSRFDYIDAARAAGEQFADLVHTVTTPECRLAGNPEWTVDACIGHVSCAPSWYLGLARGEGTWSGDPLDLRDHNAKQIANLPTLDTKKLAARLLDDLDTLLDTISHFGARVPETTFDDGRHVRADAALGILIGEFLVHGHDIARTVHARWDIDPSFVPLVARGRHQIAAGWVNPETTLSHTATYDIRLRGCDERFVYEFTDGHLEINPERPRPADVHIVSDPVVAMLSAYGRTSPTWALLSGKAWAWGSRPWLAARLSHRFIHL